MTETGELRCMTANRPSFAGINAESKRAILFQPRCKLWSCPTCSVINRQKLAMEAYHATEKLIDSGEQLYFLTLTSHRKLDAKQTLWVWPKGWKKLQARVRYYAGGFTYLAIPEQHRNGRLHMHLIETAGLGTRFWKDAGAACGLGYKNEEEQLRSPAFASFYVTKYISKQMDMLDWPKGFRRIRKSRDWPKAEIHPALEEWEYQQIPKKVSLQDAKEELRLKGFEVSIIDYTELFGTLTNID